MRIWHIWPKFVTSFWFLRLYSSRTSARQATQRVGTLAKQLHIRTTSQSADMGAVQLDKPVMYAASKT